MRTGVRAGIVVMVSIGFGAAVWPIAAGRAEAAARTAAGAAGEAGPAGGEPVDLEAIHRIKDEAFGRSQVMDHLFSMTDTNGPRLTGSPGLARAANWAVERLRAWGLAAPHLETWGRFGRGWSVERYKAWLFETLCHQLLVDDPAADSDSALATAGLSFAADLQRPGVARESQARPDRMAPGS